jgi:hypothetical protein
MLAIFADELKLYQKFYLPPSPDLSWGNIGESKSPLGDLGVKAGKRLLIQTV